MFFFIFDDINNFPKSFFFGKTKLTVEFLLSVFLS